MKKLVMVIMSLVAMFLFTSVVGAEPIQYGAPEPKDGSIEMFQGKVLKHNQKLASALETLVYHGTWFKVQGRTKNVKFPKGSFKVIGVYYSSRDFSVSIKGLARVDNDPNGLMWFEMEGVCAGPEDMKVCLHKNIKLENYQDPTLVSYYRMRE